MRRLMLSSLFAALSMLTLGPWLISVGSAPIAAAVLAQTTPTAVAGPDLTITLIGSQDPVPSGGILTYSMVVSNRGGTTAGATTVSIVVPTGTEVSSVGPGCAQVGGAVTCNLSPLVGGAT